MAYRSVQSAIGHPYDVYAVAIVMEQLHLVWHSQRKLACQACGKELRVLLIFPTHMLPGNYSNAWMLVKGVYQYHLLVDEVQGLSAYHQWWTDVVLVALVGRLDHVSLDCVKWWQLELLLKLYFSWYLWEWYSLEARWRLQTQNASNQKYESAQE